MFHDDAVKFEIEKATADLKGKLLAAEKRVADLEALIRDFPGHIAEDSWYAWIYRKNQLLGKG